MIKVAVVEDNETIREGLQEIINGTTEFSCQAIYPKCETFIKDVKKINPDILLIDIGLPGMNGIECIKKTKEIFPELIILVLTVYDENEILFSALCAGACGYIVKKTPPQKLLQMVKEAFYGYSYMSSVIADKVINFFNQKMETNNNYHKVELTNHEKEILNRLMEGFSIKAIADLFSVDVQNIGTDFRNIFKKLHLISTEKLIRTNGEKEKPVKTKSSLYR